MNDRTYQRWWELHLRVARGESLSPEDQDFYEAERQQLDQSEALRGQAEELQQALAGVAALEAERSALEARRRQVEAEIARLETALGETTKQVLGVGD